MNDEQKNALLRNANHLKQRIKCEEAVVSEMALSLANGEEALAKLREQLELLLDGLED